MPLKDDDYQLSMKIARRGKLDSPDLRSLIVNRLTDTLKVILRRPLSDKARSYGVFCEHCQRWNNATEVPEELTCDGCNRRFRIETVIYAEIE
jgi:hypothetical protein